MGEPVPGPAASLLEASSGPRTPATIGGYPHGTSCSAASANPASRTSVRVRSAISRTGASGYPGNAIDGMRTSDRRSSRTSGISAAILLRNGSASTWPPSNGERISSAGPGRSRPPDARSRRPQPAFEPARPRVVSSRATPTSHGRIRRRHEVRTRDRARSRPAADRRHRRRSGHRARRARAVRTSSGEDRPLDPGPAVGPTRREARSSRRRSPRRRRARARPRRASRSPKGSGRSASA